MSSPGSYSRKNIPIKRHPERSLEKSAANLNQGRKGTVAKGSGFRGGGAYSPFNQFANQRSRGRGGADRRTSAITT